MNIPSDWNFAACACLPRCGAWNWFRSAVRAVGFCGLGGHFVYACLHLLATTVLLLPLLPRHTISPPARPRCLHTTGSLYDLQQKKRKA